MDPLSIAKGSASLVVLCVKLSATLYTWINETRQVDTTVTALYEEVLALSRVLDGISKPWKKNPQIASAQSDAGSLWVSVKTSIDDCKATIEKMNMMLDDVQKVGFMGRGFLRRPTKQIKFGLKTKDISVYKQRVQFYNNAMQSALHMINLCLLLQSNSSQEIISRTLSDLKSQIGRVETALVSREEQQISHDDDQKESERISQNLHQFVRAAEDFYSSASTFVGNRSTVWRGSILGDPLTRDQFSTIEEWIPPPHIVEENEQREENASSTALSAFASDPYANGNSAADTDLTSAEDVHLSDSDSDIEKDLTKKFQKLAVLKLKERDYEKAEQFFQKAIDRSTTEAQPPEKITAMKVKLAFTYCFQGRWAEAESIIDPIGMDKQKVDVAASHGLHTLALLYFGKDDLEAAEKYCKRALTGKKKIWGKNHASYFESINLLCRVYSAKGSQAESECYRSFLPVEHTNELPNSRLDYLNKAMSGKKIAALSTAPDLIPSPLKDIPPPERITQSYVEGIQPVSDALNRSGRFIVGVDFGITDSAVAFGIQDSAFDVSTVAVVTNWPGASNRTLEVLYYDDQQKVVGWGTDVVDAISPLGWPKQGIQKLEWFKLQLMVKVGNSYLDAIKPPLLPPGKTEIDVVADFLSELRKATRLHFQSILGEYFDRTARDILYYFTVPPVFNEAARSALRAAAIQAGYLRDEHDHSLTLIE